VPFKSALHKCQEQVSDERYSDLDFYRVLAYAIEVAQRKVLFKLFEERLDLPSPLIDCDDVLDIEVEAVRQKLDFLLLASSSGCLGFNIRNDPSPVRRAVL